MTRDLPEPIPGARPFRKFDSADAAAHKARPRTGKVVASLASAIADSGLRHGGTISFHHHLRDGDLVVNMVLAQLAAMGFRDLHVAASSLFPVHGTMVEHIRSGVVTRISSAYITGPVANAISAGELPHPAIMQTHGGRARAIAAGELVIDVAFIAAPCADGWGNMNGSCGPSACGPLGYAMVDARHARHVIGITDHLSTAPLASIDIPQNEVDAIVAVDTIGDPAKIVSGTTRVTTDPVALDIAATTARLIDASGLLVDGFSFQTGAGGTSLAVAAALARIMRAKKIVGSFASGGITSALVGMLREGLFRTLYDVQCFDLEAVASFRENPGHLAMSAQLYASPGARGCIADRLDVMILGAAEVDVNFNVNVSALASGRIIGGSGGHADTAAGARLAIVTTMLRARSIPKIVSRVACVTTPGDTIDVVVTEAGVAVNPARQDLIAALNAAGIAITPIETLRDMACAGAPPPATEDRAEGPIVALVQYRDGSIIDVVCRTPPVTAP
ncbi:citrate lyase subunit alpha [Novosphingobium rosa]|uniref:citrate lyase subunit alpha n=1 Tax=Novosphingobium rosa TaxID=76978 RepID=UPI00082AE2A5|nr:citrate lyase subunit alpha [Novosphingobium rosa]